MSMKQKEHYKNYHLEDLNLNDDDEKDKKEEILKNTVWEELAELKKTLSTYDPSVIKSYIKKNLSNDVIEIKKNFYKEFGNLPNDNILKREVMILLGELGIVIYNISNDNKDNLDYLG